MEQRRCGLNGCLAIALQAGLQVLRQHLAQRHTGAQAHGVTGNATATGSMNLEKTQDVARETTHKRMRKRAQALCSVLGMMEREYPISPKDVTTTP